MKKVVDSNFFTSPQLQMFLRGSVNNFAVLCEFSGLEAYKSLNPCEGLAATVSILKRFPKQVIVLKATRTISKQKINRLGYLKRAINNVETREFAEFCERVELARNGHEEFRRQITQLARDAIEEADQALVGAQAHVDAARDLFQHFSAAEVAVIREGRELDGRLFTKMLDHVLEMTVYAHDDLGVNIREAAIADVANTIIFRALVCNYLMALRWQVSGSPLQRPERVRNHVYDCGFAAYATLFDGLLTNDVAAQTTYRYARNFIGRLERELTR